MGKPLLDVLRELSLDPDKQAAFDDNPARYLAQFGYEDVEADHLSEAFSLVADTLPPDAAQAVVATNPVTAVSTDTSPAIDDGSGGAPDTTINPDEAVFGGVDESFDTAALNGDDGPGTDLDAVVEVDDLPDVDEADGNGGYGTGELSLDDLDDAGFAADGVDSGDTVAFGVGSESTDGDGDGSDTGLADDSPPLLEGDAEAFALDAGGADTGLADDAFDDAADADGAGVDDIDDIDDGPIDDLSFDDIGSF